MSESDIIKGAVNVFDFLLSFSKLRIFEYLAIYKYIYIYICAYTWTQEYPHIISQKLIDNHAWRQHAYT